MNASVSPDDGTGLRRELKYLMPLPAGRYALERVRSRVPSLSIEHPPRQVTSVYFDSATYECYWLSNSGVSRRVKMRLRWYGEPAAALQPSLEIKRRLSHHGSKRRYELGPINMREMTWAEIRARIAARLSGIDGVRFGLLHFPIVLVTYRRDYLITTDRRIRVTVDTNLRFIDQRHRHMPNLAFDAVAANFAVIECKFDDSVQQDVAKITQPLGLRWSRFSKYCFGLDALTRP